MSKGEEQRETWRSKADFLLSCTGFCVGFGNIWRFPYLCYKNGGGAFMLPYLLCIVLLGFPILFLEIALGQFTRKGSVAMWDICPLVKGIGYCTLLFAALECVYYNVILAWVGYYFVVSFSSVLPWTHCDNQWNTIECRTVDGSQYTTNLGNATYNVTANKTQNDAIFTDVNMTLSNSSVGTHSSVEFWWREALQLTGGLDSPGNVCVHLLVSLAVFWAVVYLCIFKGIRWSGKVVYFTATFPYLLLVTLLILTALQTGAGDGVVYFIKPRFDRLADAQVWFQAASQVLFSYAVSLAALPAFGSYCPFKNNCFRDSLIISVINSLTSLLAGFVVFAMLGHMAHAQNELIENVATSGPGLAFIVYPQGLSSLPVPQLWCVLFFFMMVLVGLDSQFACVEGVMSAFLDLFPRWLGWRKLVLAILLAILFVLGIPMVTQGGMYVFQLVDFYLFGGYIPQILCLLEVVAIGWVYGANRFYGNIESMIGYRLNIWMKLCWTVFTPVLLMSILVFQIVTYQPLTYNTTYVYPPWANTLGFLLTVLVLAVIPLYTVAIIVRTKGATFKQRVKNAMQSKVRNSSEKDEPGATTPLAIGDLHDQCVYDHTTADKSHSV